MVDKRWSILGVLFIARTAMGFQFQSVASLSPFLIRDLAIGYAEIGTLIGLYLLPGIFIALPSGLLSRRFGDKRIASYGLLFMVTGGILFGLSQSYPLTFTGRLVSGIGAILFNVTVTKMVTDWFTGKELRTALSIMLASWPGGIALGLVMFNPLADAFSWPAAMYLTAAVSTVSFVLVVALYHNPATAVTPDDNAKRLLIPLRELLPVSMAGLAWAGFNVGFAIYVSFMPDLLAEQGLSTASAGVLVSLAVWITLVSVPLGGYLTDRSGRSTSIIVIFTLITAVVVGLFPYLSFPVGLSILVGLSLGPPPGAIVALPSQAVSQSNRGPGFGVFYTWFYLGMAIGPAMAGVGRDLTGNAATPLLIGAVLFALVGPLVGLFYLTKKLRPSE